MTSGRQTPIRIARPGDLDALLRLENAAFDTDRLDRRALRHAIGSATILALIAEDALGYALIQLRRGSSVGRLTSLAVRPDVAGRGIGRSLVSAAERAASAAGCDRVRLEVRADNEGARRLYEAVGFSETGQEPDYYEDGATAIRYEKRLG